MTLWRITVTALADKIRTEADAWEFLEGFRWPTGVRCPEWQGTDVYLIVPKNGVSRRTVSGSMSQRRTWNCRPCRPQFSATTGTMMQGTRLPLRLWVLVIFEMSASKNGVSSAEIQRKYGICNRSAWFLMHRIREAMAAPYQTMFTGVVLADEAYVGGDPENRHASAYRESDGRGTEKTPVVSIMDQATGELRSHVVVNVDGLTLGRILMGNVDPVGSTLVTDMWKGYNLPGSFFSKHERVNHSAGEYVRDGFTTNPLESFFSQMKRSIDGTHHHVSVKHLHRYLAEHDFCRSTCKDTDTQRMTAIVEQSEWQRLTYDKVRA